MVGDEDYGRRFSVSLSGCNAMTDMFPCYRLTAVTANIRLVVYVPVPNLSHERSSSGERQVFPFAAGLREFVHYEGGVQAAMRGLIRYEKFS